MKKEWHEYLQAKTKKAFEDINNSPLTNLLFICMKNYNGKFGTIKKNDVLNNNLIINDLDDHIHYTYVTIDDLLLAGWIID